MKVAGHVSGTDRAFLQRDEQVASPLGSAFIAFYEYMGVVESTSRA